MAEDVEEEKKRLLSCTHALVHCFAQVARREAARDCRGGARGADGHQESGTHVVKSLRTGEVGGEGRVWGWGLGFRVWGLGVRVWGT
jgi:hypothetical protein